MAVRGAVQVPVTRVFSLYVVQAGSACPRDARGGPAPTACNRAGEKLRAAGRQLPVVSGGVGPRRLGGLAVPLICEEGPGHPGGCGRSAGQAASGWQAGAYRPAGAPEATAASQLVSWTTME